MTKGLIMEFSDLSPEVQEKLKGAKTPEEIMALAKEEGYELSEEELDGISGGACWDCVKCHNYQNSLTTGT